MKEGNGSRAAFVSTVARTRKQLCVFDRFNRLFLPVLLSPSLLSPPFPHSSSQRYNNSRPNRPEVACRFFSPRLAVFQCALCARVSPPLPWQDLFPTLVISALPFVSPPLFSSIRFDSLSALSASLVSLPIFEFSISRLWLWRERERGGGNFHGDVRVDLGDWKRRV